MLCENVLLITTRPSFYQCSFLFTGSFAHHGVHGVDGPLELLPNGLVDELLALHWSLAFKSVRYDFDGDVRSVGIIVGT